MKFNLLVLVDRYERRIDCILLIAFIIDIIEYENFNYGCIMKQIRNFVKNMIEKEFLQLNYCFDV